LKKVTLLYPDFTLLVDESAPDQSFNLPRLNRIFSSLFTNEIQTTPLYLRVIEFLKLNSPLDYLKIWLIHLCRLIGMSNLALAQVLINLQVGKMAIVYTQQA
jgi:hypothetical protein